jgi:RecA-family ATPase
MATQVEASYTRRIRGELHGRRAFSSWLSGASFAIPGILSEGLGIIAGAPKLAKSWLLMGLAVAVASGPRALGMLPVDGVVVLYLALEDPPRRLKSRLEMILAGDLAPAGLHFHSEWPRFSEGPRATRRLASSAPPHAGCLL